MRAGRLRPSGGRRVAARQVRAGGARRREQRAGKEPGAGPPCRGRAEADSESSCRRGSGAAAGTALPGGCGRPQPGRRCVRGRGRIISEWRIARHPVGVLRNASGFASRSGSALRFYRAGSARGFPSLEGSIPSCAVAE